MVKLRTPDRVGGHSIWPSALASLADLLDVLNQGVPEWMAEAACVGKPELFFPPNVGGSRPAARARAICGRCPVRQFCQEWNDAIEGSTTNSGGLAGVYAGETPRERAARRRG